MHAEPAGFKNAYEDDAFAAAYARLEFPGTYYLAFRDIPELLSRHVRGRRALDFGCGAGRSTRFLVKLGFEAVGVDIAEEMIRRARAIDPSGAYHLIADGDLSRFADGTFDLVMSAFTFDNIPTESRKVALFREFARVLKNSGRVINLVSTPDIYCNEWTSFTTRDFPENRHAKCGDPVKIIGTSVDDHRPVVDILWPEENYRDGYRQAGLEVIDVHRPLGRADEPYPWVSETKIAPWAIYVVGKV